MTTLQDRLRQDSWPDSNTLDKAADRLDQLEAALADTQRQLEDVTRERDAFAERRCEVCGYAEHHREHTGCLRKELAALRADAEKWRAHEARKQSLLGRGFLKSPLRSCDAAIAAGKGNNMGMSEDAKEWNAMVRRIDQLTAQLAERDAEIARLKSMSVCEACVEIPSVTEYFSQVETQLAAQQLESQRLRADAERYRGIIESLWQIIDDIDTYGDMAKGDDSAFRKMVEKRQTARWNTGITTDGYTLNIDAAIAAGKGEE